MVISRKVGTSFKNLFFQKCARDIYGQNKKNYFLKIIFSKNHPSRGKIMRGIDCAHSRSEKTLPWTTTQVCKDRKSYFESKIGWKSRLGGFCIWGTRCRYQFYAQPRRDTMNDHPGMQKIFFQKNISLGVILGVKIEV